MLLLYTLQINWQYFLYICRQLYFFSLLSRKYPPLCKEPNYSKNKVILFFLYLKVFAWKENSQLCICFSATLNLLYTPSVTCNNIKTNFNIFVISKFKLKLCKSERKINNIYQSNKQTKNKSDLISKKTNIKMYVCKFRTRKTIYCSHA